MKDLPSHTSSHGTCPSRLHILCIAVALAGAGIPLTVMAGDALPQGGSIISGSGSISQNGNEMTVNTQSARTAINWQRFSVGADNRITFNQPDGKSVTLNRVIGSDPSKIYGAVTSNGQLILVNPNGVWIGPKAHISSSALVASAGFLTEEQAKKFAESGKLDIQLTGNVTNQGRITVHDNGMVALLGAQVNNAGVIQARKGMVQLATGPQATLDFHGDGLLNIAVSGEPGEKDSVNPDVTGGVHNSGEIDVGNGTVAMSAARAAKHLDSVINVGGNVLADSVSTDGGTVVLGNSAKTNVTGSISATGVNGGQIKVLGDEVNVVGSAKIDASGTQGSGGKVLVGGSYQGKGTEQAAKNTTVAKGAQLKADGKTDGGQVVVWSDGKTHFAGQASAKGGQRGGVVETSGQQLTVTSDANVSTKGSTADGTWLLDPATVNIEATDTDGSGQGSVAASAIVNGLAQGNVTIYATDTLNVNAPIIATNFATVNNDGRTSKSTLALISSGNAGTVSAYTGTDKTRTSGAVNIRAPILLKDGNLYISATGDIRLIDNAGSATGDAAYNKRAIIDVGSGVAWLKTGDTASIFQDNNTALIGDKVALDGASVRMESGLNYAGTLAGQASNGIFRFTQTNATGAEPITTDTVTAPYTGEQLTGVKAYTLSVVGSQNITSYQHANETYRSVTLSAGGQQFDYIIFEATSYTGRDGRTISPATLLTYLDSSDYLVNGLSFRDTNNVQWQFIPDGTKDGLTKVLRNGVEVSTPVGFSLSGVGGVAVAGTTSDSSNKPYWGVLGDYIPGAQLQAEIQYNEQTQSSQQLAIKLGSTTTSVLAQIGWLMNDGSNTTNDARYENAKVQFLKTQDRTAQNVQITSNKATVTATPADASRTYGDANPPLSQSLAENTQASKVSGIDNYVDRMLGRTGITQSEPTTAATQQSNVGQYDIKGGLAAGSFAQKRYELNSGTGKLTVTPAELTVTAKDKAKTYGTGDPTLDYEVSGEKLGQTGADILNGGALARESGEDVIPGGYAINQGGLGLNNGLGGNYTLKFVDGKLEIVPAELVMQAGNEYYVYNGNVQSVYGYVYYGLIPGDEAVIKNVVLSGQGRDVGSYVTRINNVTLDPSKSANYTVRILDGLLTIIPAPLTLTAGSAQYVYDGMSHAAPWFTAQGLMNGDTIRNDSVKTSGQGTNVGSYVNQIESFNLDPSIAHNYSVLLMNGQITITPAELRVRALDAGKTYGDADPLLAYSVSGLAQTDSLSKILSGAIARESGENVGEYGINKGTLGMTGELSQNYILHFDDGVFTVSPATLTVQANGVTKFYGDLDPELTYRVSGYKGNDTPETLVSGQVVRDAGENAGTYAINQGTVGLTGAAGQNYILQYTGGDFVITPVSLQVEANSHTKVYGDVDPELTYKISGLKNGDQEADVVSGTLTRQTGENVGNYGIGQGNVGLTDAASGNYIFTFVDGQLAIIPAKLTVHAKDDGKVYGDADPTFSHVVTGFKGTDTESSVLNGGSVARQAGENVGSYGIGQGTLDLNGGVGSNYILDFKDGVFTISPATLTVTADGKTKVYGEADPTLKYRVDGLKGNDVEADVMNSGSLVRQAGEDVGNYGINQGSVDLNGGAGKNYVLHYEAGTFSITPATLVVTADGSTKVYGDFDPKLTYSVTGMRNGDTEDQLVAGSVVRDAGENVGSYAIRQGDVDLTSGKGQNYVLSFANGTFTVTPATLEVTADSHTKVYGDLDPTLSYTVTGFKGSDSEANLGLSGDLSRATGENVGNYSIGQGNLSVGGDSNYVLSFVNGNLAITPATLTVKADDQTKVYGDADPLLSHVITGYKNGDTETSVLKGAIGREAGEDVRAGGYTIHQGSLGLNNGQGSNYVLEFENGTLHITPAQLNVTANNDGKVYGELDPTLTFKVDGLKGADKETEALAGQLARQAGEDVKEGGYAINQGTLSLTGKAAQNYILTYASGTFTITPATLMVRADDSTKVYGEVDPTLSYQVTGFKHSDDKASVLSGNVARQAGEDVKAGGYAIGKGDLTSTTQNYILHYEEGTFTITPASLQIDFDDHSKVYGEIDPALTYRVNGLKNGDSQASVVSGQASRAAGENVGNYAIGQGSLGANGNYILTFNEGKLAITPAELTVTADHKTKVYGDLDPTLTYSVSGLKHGDTQASVTTGSLARISGENVTPEGYAITQGNVTLTSGNYRMVFRDGNLQVTPAPLVVTADNQSKMHGATDPTLTWSVSGLKGKDQASIAQGSLLRAPGEDAGSYAISQNQAFSAGNNYSVSFRDGALTITGPLAPVPPEQPGLPPLPMTAQSPGNARCTALESPAAASANYSVSPAVVRSYAVQLVCKPRSYQGKTSTTADLSDVLTYANSLFKDGQFIVPEAKRSVIPQDLKPTSSTIKGGK
ncbi:MULTISPECIES: MBG domain-containing protein [unclassified Pseudomonas]|uniref:MBG domain-containing protein n=1 Tax=unclassified Pseudomonas TaxID=196821 RepID=UPI001CE0E51D|nr:MULTISPECIES: MBG domain-containing protein [unclassified Pseudomonas]